MFKSARLKLTFWYLLVIMLVSVAFSLVIYKSQSDEIVRFAAAQRLRLERRIRDQYSLPPDTIINFTPPLPFDTQLVEQSESRLLTLLILINSGILLSAGLIGHFLAGKTLQPIKNMVDDQSRFVSDASHELRTPLTALKSSMEVALRDKNMTIKDARSLIGENITDVNKLQSLTENLLQIVQFDKSNGEKKFSQAIVSEIINASVKKVLPLARKKKIEIIPKVADTSINCDSDSLVQLLIILLDNAVKFSPANSKILISSTKNSGHVKISVQDFGQGIEKADLPHIFDRFYQGSPSRTKNVKGGYGLGLSIAKKIVDAHNGAISVVSIPKKGTTFVVHLPVKYSK